MPMSGLFRRARSEPTYDVVFFQPGVGSLLAPQRLPPPGGAEVQILRVAGRLARRGWRVALIVRGPRHGLPEAVDGVRLLPILDAAWGGPAPGIASRVVRIWRTIRRLTRTRATVFVQRNAGRVTGPVALAAKIRRSRFVYSSANVLDFDFDLVDRSRISQAMFRLGIRLADCVVVQSTEQERLCEERYGRSGVMIRSIALPAEPRRAAEALVWIGRLDDYKRPDAFVTLARTCPDLRCWMIAIPGSPAFPEASRRLRSAAEEIPNLHLLPPRPHDAMGEVLDRAVAVVNTALYEGMPNVFLEGWARGVPALAHSHDPDGVIEREGLGAFAGGSDERFAELACELWNNRFDQSGLSARCRAYIAREHAPEAVVAGWERALGLRSGID
jgi:glycosyltransferase involved in cell wall biosynthesis